MNKILVTGFSGFVGRHLTSKLLEQGHSIVGVDNLSGSDFEAVNTKIERYYINEFDSKPILDLVQKQKFDTIILLAAKPRVSYSMLHPAETYQNNVQATINLLEAARGNCKRVIFTSSSSVYGDCSKIGAASNLQPKNPQSFYALQKSQIEDALKIFATNKDFEAISLRPFNIFGQYARGDSPYSTCVAAWLHAIKHNEPLRSDAPHHQKRDMTHINNVVHAFMLALNSKKQFAGECYNVGCGESIGNDEVLAKLREKFSNIKVIYAGPRPGDVYMTKADISATVNDLGYKVLTPFWEGLDLTIKAELSELI